MISVNFDDVEYENIEKVKGVVNSAAKFTRSKISIADVDPVQSYSVASWIYIDDYGDNNSHMLVFEKSGAYYMNVLSQTRGNKTRGHLRVGGHFTDGKQKRWEFLDTPTPVPIGQWFHAAYVVNEGSMSLYINGRRVAETRILPNLLDTNLELTLGALWKAKEGRYKGWFYGLLDEFALYSRPLTAQEILSLAAKKPL